MKRLMILRFKLPFKKILIKSYYGVTHIVCKSFMLSNSTAIQSILPFQNILSKFFLWPLSTSIFDILKKWYLQDHFFKENIALVLIFLIILDQKTRILSFTRFFIILMKNGCNMMCFLSKKVLLLKDNTVWSILPLKRHLIFF